MLLLPLRTGSDTAGTDCGRAYISVLLDRIPRDTFKLLKVESKWPKHS